MKQNDLIVLRALSEHHGAGLATPAELAKKTGLEISAVNSTLESLYSEGLVTLIKDDLQTVVLTEEGRRYENTGSPEFKLANAVGKKGSQGIGIYEAADEANLNDSEKQVALNWGFRKKLLRIEKAGSKSALHLAAKNLVDDIRAALTSVLKGQKIGSEVLAELKSRGLVEEKTTKRILAGIKQTGKARLGNASTEKEVSQLSPQMLKSGEWKKPGVKFAEYELTTVTAPLQVARKHPYRQFMQGIKEKLVGLGFREVRGSLAEIEFWNLDALYMPQDHPARQIHDVFFVKHPHEKLAGKGAQGAGHYAGEIADAQVFEQVFAAHKHGGKTGSRGWQYEMSREISSRVILRSHDTGISAREMFKKLQPPDRVFFIAHVFRPDEIDWKHFIEFNQLGGYVADENTSFRDLLGTLKTFAEEVFEAEKIKFVPSYFPFTEPSVELYAKIPGRGWAEIGGAGLCRPEMLAALGIDYPVIAWGLGIDRLAMLSIGINDIRELHSHNIPFLQGK